MTVLASKGNVPNTYKELIRRIMIFEYGELLLLKSSKNKVASDLVISGKKKENKLGISYMSGLFWDKVIDFTYEPVIPTIVSNVATVRNTLLNDNDNDSYK